jgi:hypothetical protein
MTSPDEPVNSDESLNHQVDAICARFEDAWMSGSVPRIEDFLERLPGDTDDSLLLKLIALDAIVFGTVDADAGFGGSLVLRLDVDPLNAVA